jgi:hypothetical protein
MPQFHLGYAGRRFSILGEDMRLDLVPCGFLCRFPGHVALLSLREERVGC